MTEGLHQNYLDENAISVPCAIDGCNTRVYGDVRCPEHGGDPTYSWTTSDWGETTYRGRISRPIQSVTGHPTAARGNPS